MGAPETGRFFICRLGRNRLIYLRAADGLDSGSLAELRAASLVELGLLCAPDVDAFVGRASREFCALFRAERVAAWIACDADRVVASSCAIFYDRLPYPDGSRHAELCGVYVMPAYRKRGIASELVREVVAAAHAGGARKIFLRPTKTAKSLYARLGFVETELMTLDSRHDRSPSGPVLAASPSR
jgi:ribosomal protein S18 acetylase RimI-like enzyme